MEPKQITITIKDPQRFLWGINEFYPETKVIQVKKDNEWHTINLQYTQKGPRDGVAGYCRGYRNY